MPSLQPYVPTILNDSMESITSKKSKTSQRNKVQSDSSDSSDSDDDSSDSWETESSNSFESNSIRLTSLINQTKEEIKVMTMVYIWEENKVLIGMRKRKQNDEDLCTYIETGKSYRTQDLYHCHTCGFDRNEDKEEKKNTESILQEVKEDWKLNFNYNQVSIIDFEFKKKKQNNLEENIIARKWQLAELDAETPECFNISDVPYNKMWKADVFWKENFGRGKNSYLIFVMIIRVKYYCMM